MEIFFSVCLQLELCTHQSLKKPTDTEAKLSMVKKMSLAVISHELGPVSSRTPGHRMGAGMPLMLASSITPKIVATHTLQDAPALDILLIPGGGGNRLFEETNDTRIED